MKGIFFVSNFVLVIFFVHPCIAQQHQIKFIPSQALAVTTNKTTNLIFPFAVQSIDRGSKDILVQQPGGTENIVQVKADKPAFNQTNLSVITVDGKLYSFTVDYAAEPAQLNIIIQAGNEESNDTSQHRDIAFESSRNDALYLSVAKSITDKKAKHIKRNKHNKMLLLLQGIYFHRDILYFRMQLKNKSNVSYDVDRIVFVVKDRQQSKRTATQETELTPVFKYGNLQTALADSSASGVMALPKFTLPDGKILLIQVLEKNGGRSLLLDLKNRKIMKATPIKNL